MTSPSDESPTHMTDGDGDEVVVVVSPSPPRAESPNPVVPAASPSTPADSPLPAHEKTTASPTSPAQEHDASPPPASPPRSARAPSSGRVGGGHQMSALLGRYAAAAEAAAEVMESDSDHSSCSTCSTSTCSDSQCSRCACRSISPPPPRLSCRPASAPPLNPRHWWPLPGLASSVQRIPTRAPVTVVPNDSSPSVPASAAARVPLSRRLGRGTRSPEVGNTRRRSVGARETNLRTLKKKQRTTSTASPTPTALKRTGRLSVHRVASSAASPSASASSSSDVCVEVDEAGTLLEESRADSAWMTQWVERVLDQPPLEAQEQEQAYHSQPQQPHQPALYHRQQPHPLQRAKSPFASDSATASSQVFATAASLLARAPPVPVCDRTPFYPLWPAAHAAARYPPPAPHHFLTRRPIAPRTQMAPPPPQAHGAPFLTQPRTQTHHAPSAPPPRSMNVLPNPSDGGVIIDLEDSDDED